MLSATRRNRKGSDLEPEWQMFNEHLLCTRPHDNAPLRPPATGGQNGLTRWLGSEFTPMFSPWQCSPWAPSQHLGQQGPARATRQAHCREMQGSCNEPFCAQAFPITWAVTSSELYCDLRFFLPNHPSGPLLHPTCFP